MTVGYRATLDSLKCDIYAAAVRTLANALVEELRAALGADAVIAEPHQLVVYECDAYTLERHLPDAVVLPRSTDEVVTAVRIAARHQRAIIPRGAGTSLSGAVLAVDGGVVIGTARMNRVLEVDARNRRALVEAGCVNADISAVARPYGLHFAPDPSSQGACTVGGNVAMNSGGPHTLKYGVTTNHVLGLELVLPDGEVVWLGATPDSGDDVEGYDLRGVVVGSEGMFGVVTRVLVKLVPVPPAWRTMLAIFPGVDEASRAVSAIIAAGIVPAALEMMDQLITQAVEEAYRFGFPSDAGAVLIIELDGLEAGLERQAERVRTLCREHGAREVRHARTEGERAELWKCRKRAFGAIGRLSPSFLTQDGVVPRSALPQIMRHIRAVSEKYGLRIPNVFHAGDGNIHPLVLFDERDPDQVRRAVAAGNEILEHCLALGGSVTGEHGIGVEKIDFMERQFRTADLEAMRAVRRVFDPVGRCNPHKMFPGSKRCADFQVRKQAAA
ncbi:MAG: FAD-linked oxidase C-terminal domain-containing protein [Verrucomicrobiae bacterium]|nr:FAD-linked oxidase C-terminal domain-containing protein [Verrucomicrobiae bacterium]